MSIFIEIILWAIIIAGTGLGIKYGFIKMAAKPVKFVLSVVLAFSICTAFAEGIIVPIIEKPITNYIYDFLSKNCPDLTVENIANELPTVLKMAAGMYGINIEELVEQNAGMDIILEITNTLSAPVIQIFSVIVSFILVYFLAKLLITLALALLDFIFSDGLFGALNRTLGGISGTILAIAVAWALATFVEFLFHINSDGMDGGFLYTFFNTYNPIEILLSF